MRPRRRLSRSALIVAAVCVAAACAGVAVAVAVHRGGGRHSAAGAITRPCGNPGRPTRVRHVVWIWMENESFAQVTAQGRMPHERGLATSCGLAADFHNESHGSLSNYLAATSGRSPLGTSFVRDCLPSPTCSIPAGTANLFSQSAALPGGWRTYAGSMPSPCFRGNVGLYAARHNPAVYYDGLAHCTDWDIASGDPGTGSGTLYHDVHDGRLPAFAFVAPDLRDDAHNGATTVADRWLADTVRVITQGPDYRAGNTVVFLTTDEGCDGTCGPDYRLGEDCAAPAAEVAHPSCHVATVVIAPHLRPGTVNTVDFTHYSLLRTTEELLGLPVLGLARSAASMRAAFDLGPAPGNA